MEGVLDSGQLREGAAIATPHPGGSGRRAEQVPGGQSSSTSRNPLDGRLSAFEELKADPDRLKAALAVAFPQGLVLYSRGRGSKKIDPAKVVPRHLDKQEHP